MGLWKERAYDKKIEERDRRLADVIGITYDELNELDYEPEFDQSDDGVIYNHRIEFRDNSPKHILKKIKGLKEGCTVYLQPGELYNEYEYDYEEEFEAITENKNFLQKFKDEIAKLEALSSLEILKPTIKGILNRQIFISVIGAMETFLSEVFINLTFDKDEYFRNFIETHPEFKKQKFEVREIFEKYENLKGTAKKVMLDTTYHNLFTVSQMYVNTFKIEFPQINEVSNFVTKRHDLVHRNGKTKDGKILEIDKNAINDLIEKVTIFINDIATKLEIELPDANKILKALQLD